MLFVLKSRQSEGKNSVIIFFVMIFFITKKIITDFFLLHQRCGFTRRKISHEETKKRRKRRDSYEETEERRKRSKIQKSIPFVSFAS